MSAGLDLDLASGPWVIGPTDARPYDVWLPQAVELVTTTLGVSTRKQRRYVKAVLARVGQPAEDGGLPYRVLHWTDIAQLPMVASFGMSARGEESDREALLAMPELTPVEAPVVETSSPEPGVTVRRAIGYGQADGGLFVLVRYLVDDGHPELVALMETGSRNPGSVHAVLDDLDALAASMRVRDLG